MMFVENLLLCTYIYIYIYILYIYIYMYMCVCVYVCVCACVCVCVYIYNIHIYGLRFDNVTCRTESVSIPWFEKACFFLIYPIILYLLSPQPMRLQQRIINWFDLKKMFLFHVIFYAKGSFKKFCACF